MLLDGYGSYEISNDPYFVSTRLSILDRGFIFAIAHVRGGGEMGRWVLIPHSREVKLEGASVGRDFMVVSERSGGLERARVHRLPPDLGRPTAPLGEGEEIKFDEPAYSLGAYLTGDFESPVLRMSYTSLTTPSTIIDLHMGTGTG
ncbi:Protease 2 [Tetrabaena socialis]|uniref:Protease 2 n=1 Tax=Tetrabaena socialis TaxID=47790 RepID=A0A2J8ABG5_9CHLO|nr:Protease 2 [Tetrabaena socialis]|eukprot:PNH09868.1 Protease 2 [Tetrabaena socialis]